MENWLLGVAFFVGFTGGLIFFYDQLSGFTNWVIASIQ